ncbi:MAG: hypothetical protein NZ734_11765, partial [Paracoccus sp.]|nr:hypothetical protein [Paracoccus sp. (in: a-proteobacteria)]
RPGLQGETAHFAGQQIKLHPDSLRKRAFRPVMPIARTCLTSYDRANPAGQAPVGETVRAPRPS